MVGWLCDVVEFVDIYMFLKSFWRFLMSIVNVVVGVELSMVARANITLSLQRKKFCATKLHGKTVVMWKFEKWIKLFQDKVISYN